MTGPSPFQTGLIAELTKRRKKLGSQRDLAAKLGKPQSYVAKIEGGTLNLTVEKFVEYCQALSVKPETILKSLGS